MADKVPCIECGKRAYLVDGSIIYPHRPDLHDKLFWKCQCGAYVGCHDGTKSPKGLPCGPITRRARIEAHLAFDQKWKNGEPGARPRAYKWLAEQLGLPPEKTHIGMFDAATARRVVEICRDA